MDEITKSESPSSLITVALRKILQPLLKLLISKGVTLSLVTNILKETYVSVAEKEFSDNKKHQTDSSISVLTGVHRKDVKKLRNQTIDKQEIPESIAKGSQIVALWVSNPETTNDEGWPISLPKKSKNTKEVSFETLVTSFSKDIRPRTLLDEWLRLGVVSIDDNNRVKLNNNAFIPEKGYEEKIFYFGRNIHDHIETAMKNLLNEESKSQLERSVHYAGLTKESLKKIEDLSQQLAMDNLLKINKIAKKYAENDKNSNDKKYRFNFGVYFFKDRITDEQLED